MGQQERHDSATCVCVKYKPKLVQYGIRLNGINFYCKGCARYVDPKKWKGGMVHFSNRSRMAKYNECPCCGRKMARHRRAKKKLIDSIQHQIEHPEMHLAEARKALKGKKKLIDSGLLIPTVQ